MSVPRPMPNRTRSLVFYEVPVLLLAALAALASCASAPSGNVLSDSLSQPLNGATAATIDISSGPGHLSVDKLTDGSKLADGTLEYLEKQGTPTRTADLEGSHATLALKPGGTVKSGFRFPWQACWGGAYQWQVNLNPSIPSDITAHSAGGNMKLNLADMTVTRLFAQNEGGNIDVILPNDAADLDATAKTGAGNVTVDVSASMTGSNVVTASSGAGNVVVRVPAGLAAHIHATSGAGKVSVDSSFTKIDKNSYQSTGYDDAPNKVDITVNSGAGNTSVIIK